ncbi:MAG: hypothetical protein ACRCZD_19160 [Phycicoccus sp.]
MPHLPCRASIADPDPARPGGPGTEEDAESASRRFAAEQPNQCWQSDFTHLHLADGLDVEVITWLDDYSRKAPHLTGHGGSLGRSYSPPSAPRSTNTAVPHQP